MPGANKEYLVGNEGKGQEMLPKGKEASTGLKYGSEVFQEGMRGLLQKAEISLVSQTLMSG